MTRPSLEIGFHRWTVTIWYRSDAGLVDVRHEIDELGALAEIVERGPSWQALERIEIVYAMSLPPLTLEQAASQ